MNEQVTVIDLEAKELVGVEKSRAEHIKATFQPMTDMLLEFEGFYNEVVKQAKEEINEEVMQKAKRLRLDIAQIRINADKVKKAEKEEFVRAGKAVDGVFNILKWAVVKKENTLKSIEKHFENMESEKLEKLQIERVEELSKYLEDADERDLAGMDQDVWEAYLGTKKKAHDDVVAAEKKAEEERLKKEEEERLEQIRIKEENAKLKKEADEKERKAKLEQDQRDEDERVRKEKEDAETKARKEAEKKRLAKEEAERIKREEKETAERKAREETERKAQKIRDDQAKEQAKKEREEKEAHEKQLEDKQIEADRVIAESKVREDKLQAELDAKAEKEKMDAHNAKVLADAQAKSDADVAHNSSMRDLAFMDIGDVLGSTEEKSIQAIISAIENGKVRNVKADWKVL